MAEDDPPAALAGWLEANGISTLPQASEEDEIFVTDDGEELLESPDGDPA
jgi:hypothetical protein